MGETAGTGRLPAEEASYFEAIIATQHEVAAARPDPAVVMNLIADRTRALTGADGAVVEMAEGDEMVYRAATGSAAPHLGLRLKLSASLSGLCVRTGEILICVDTETDARVDREACRRVGMRSMVVVPLTHGGRVSGVLKVMAAREGAFDGRDVRTLRVLAGVLAPALDHAFRFASNRTLLTERAAALGALHLEREFLQAVLDHAEDGIVACDASGRLTLFNRATRRFHGLPAEPITPEGWPGRYDLYRADGVTPLPLGEVPLFRALNGEVVRDAEMVIVPKAGTPRSILASGRAIRDSGGEKLGAVVVMHDVTERKRTEAERSRAAAESAARAEAEAGERRYRTLAEAIPQIVWTAQPDGTPDYFNRRWYDYTGSTPERSLSGAGWADVLHPDDRARSLREWGRAVATGMTYEVEYRFRRAADGAYRWHLGRGTPLRDESGQIAEWFGTCTDIDDQKRAALELAAAKETAEAANRARDEFLAVLSHELRTPLTPVLAATSALLGEATTPDSFRPLLELTQRNVELEARLIDDLLDVTRISRGELTLELDVVDVHTLTHGALDLCRDELAAADHRLTVDLAAPTHHARADAARLRQLLWNLIKNAVKFTPPGGRVAVRSWNDDAGDAGPRLVIEVEDSGAGIDPNLLPSVFDAFRQGESLAKRRFGGLGLGLAISQAIAKAHRGTLAAASAGVGRGASFRVTLPAAPEAARVSPPEPAPAAPAAPAPPLKILLVEDDESTLKVMTRLLQVRGCEVASVSRVSEALEVASGADFDLIVSDIGLPDGTGWDLMRQLRARGLTRGIALTGFGMEEDVERSRDAGFLAHLTKPVDFQKLEATIRRVVAATRV